MPKPADVSALRRTFEAVKATKSNVEGTWDQIERFCLPGIGGRAEGTTADEGSASWRRDEVWDFTASTGLQRLSASIHGSVTSPAIRWFRVTAKDKKLAKDSEVAKFLDGLGDDVYDVLQESDFNTEISSADLELVGFGNSFLCVESQRKGGEWEGLDFTAIPCREGYPVHDSRQRLEMFFRRLDWTPVQMVDRFGPEGVPDRILELAQTPQGATEKQEVVFAVYKRRDYSGKAYEVYEQVDPVGRPHTKTRPRLLAPLERPFGCCYFLAAGEDEILGEEDGYYEMPVFHVVWEREAGSVWGRGPGLTILPTVKLINALCEARLNALEKAVDPAWMVTERGLLSDLDQRPGGVTAVRSTEDIKVMETATRFDAIDTELAELRAMVRRVLHEDDLMLKDSPAMTATEAQIRFELMNRVLGSTLARLQSDELDPLIHLVVATLWREGRLGDVPQKLIASGGEFAIEYQGPLSRAQRTDEVAAIERLGAAVNAFKQMEFAEAGEVFDCVAALREISARLGVPAGVLRSDEDVKRRISAREAAQQKMAQAEIVRAQGEAAQQGAEAVASAQAAGVPVPARPAPMVSPPFQE